MGECFIAIAGVLLPPLAVGIEKGCGGDFWINLLLTFLLWFPGILHCFHLFGVKYCSNLVCLFFPFIAVYMELGCETEFWISLILTLLCGLPGLIYSYYVILLKGKNTDRSKVGK